MNTSSLMIRFSFVSLFFLLASGTTFASCNINAISGECDTSTTSSTEVPRVTTTITEDNTGNSAQAKAEKKAQIDARITALDETIKEVKSSYLEKIEKLSDIVNFRKEVLSKMREAQKEFMKEFRNIKTELNKMVKNGEITSDQKQEILNEIKIEFKNQYKERKNTIRESIKELRKSL